MAQTGRQCPHCGGRLVKWAVPPGTSWSEAFFYVCFNDDCQYYRDGWAWMKQQYNQTASYRFALNPSNGASLPLPVWSASATREMIVEDGEPGGAG